MSTDSEHSDTENQLLRASKIIEEFANNLPSTPGIYRMFNKNDQLLYIGKAKNLKKRVISYSKVHRLNKRSQVMISNLDHLDISHTRSEAEALLLEMNLIKSQSPRYNILLRDDKTFPYILIRKNHPFPQILITKEKRRDRGFYHGPFGSGLAANRMLEQIQKAFLIRNCSDNVFNNRQRPCLLFQIKRCSAPCVNKISQEEYSRLVNQSRKVIKGKSSKIRLYLSQQMEKASSELNFEEAARIRDRLSSIRHIVQSEGNNLESLGTFDVIGLTSQNNQSCIHSFFYRDGLAYGSHSFFPRRENQHEDEDIMLNAIGQLYTDEHPPPNILVSILPKDHKLLEEALRGKHNRRIKIICPQRAIKKDLVDRAVHAAEESLKTRMSESSSHLKQLKALADILGWEKIPTNIEVYDNSHLQGTNAVGAMISATPEGFQKNRYRKFNIKDGVDKRDDIAMMKHVIERRFSSLKQKRNNSVAPDLIIIDGGKNQLNVTIKTLKKLDIEGVEIISIAKGKKRNAGNETIFSPNTKEPIKLPENSPVLFLLQRLRDESHRFVINSHRNKRLKSIRKNLLDDIPGIGVKRKKILLQHFGSGQKACEASLKELQSIEGISSEIANRIYKHYR